MRIKDILDVSISINKKIFEDLTEDQLIKNNKKIKRISNFIFRNKKNLLISTGIIKNTLDEVLNFIFEKKLRIKILF